jgi:1-acyl-sn-glycerol-3-phosphate acyltransferase
MSADGGHSRTTHRETSVGVVLRSIAYSAVQIAATPLYAIVALLTFPLPLIARYRVITSWSRLMLWAAEHMCGIRYRVLNAERIPREACIILAKHQSAWETLAFQKIFPPQVWVLKRELLFVPFFGWGLAMLEPIAIDRAGGAAAMRQMLEQGRDRLARGFSIVIFPEGTRTAPGIRGRYHPGGAWLALKTGARVLPVAHNAGHCWPRRSWLKYPGLVTVSVGPALEGAAATADELMLRAEEWIENEMHELGEA